MKPIYTRKLQTINILTLIASAVSLSLGIALIANYITSIIGITKTLIIIGSALVFLSLYLITKLVSPNVKETLRLRGGFFFDPEKLKTKEIIGYEFNTDIGTYLRAIAVENKAYASALKKQNINHDSKKHICYDPDTLDFLNISASCVEFIFLNQLSLHLNSYFTHEEVDKKNIEKIPRKNMSTEVLRNRVLELITRNHNEREAFLEENEFNDDSILCYAISDNGEIYNNIELELPKGSSLTRCDDNSLKIENKVFQIKFNACCDGCHTVVERKLILGEYSAPWLVKVKIEVLIKKKLFINSTELELYQWLDSFIERFEEYMSIKKLHSRSHIQLVKILTSTNQ